MVSEVLGVLRELHQDRGIKRVDSDFNLKKPSLFNRVYAKVINVFILVLHKLVGQAASRAGEIQRVTPDGARLIGLALEEYVKNLVSKAIHAASHRNLQFKDDEHKTKVNDVKAQLKIIGGT